MGAHPRRDDFFEPSLTETHQNMQSGREMVSCEIRDAPEEASEWGPRYGGPDAAR